MLGESAGMRHSRVDSTGLADDSMHQPQNPRHSLLKLPRMRQHDHFAAAGTPCTESGCTPSAGATFTRDDDMLAAVYARAKQALPDDVLGGRVDPPKEVRKYSSQRETSVSCSARRCSGQASNSQHPLREHWL